MLRYVILLLSVLLPVAASAQVGQVPIAVQPAPASSGPTLVQSVPISGGANTISSASTDFSHATFIVILAASSSNLPSVSDSSGNSWTTISSNIFSFLGISGWYKSNPTVTTTQQFTLSGTNIQASGCILGFTGVATSSALDASNNAGNQLVTTINPGNIIPAGNGELFVTTNANAPNSSAITSQTINDSFSVVSGCTQVYVGGTTLGSATAYYVQPTAATIDPTWTFNNEASGTAAIMAAFKP